jgi:hypothetical protein
MKPILLILSMVIALSIMAGCLEDKDDQTEVYSNIANAESVRKAHQRQRLMEKQSLSEDVPPSISPFLKGGRGDFYPKGGQGGFTGVNHVNPNIASRFIGIKKTSSRSEKKQASSGLPVANPYSDKLRSFQAEYQVIVENNLFRPLGWQEEVIKEPIPIPKIETVVVEIPRERPAPTYNLTLTGIAQSGSEWIAILEDSNRKEGYFLHPGEELKDFLVSEIFAGHIILVQGDAKAQLSLGESIQYDMSGQLLLNTVANQKPDFLNPKSEIQIPNSGEGAQKSLIERMKAKRQKELSQK